MTSEPITLANMLDFTRQMTLFYLKQAGNVDKAKTFTIGDYTTNSIQWIIAHLAWAETYLILRGVGNHDYHKSWFELFAMGKPSPAANKFPAYKEVFSTFNQVHKTAIAIIRDLPDAALDEINHIDLKLAAGQAKRIVIMHCIRHENAHTGQIGILLRMHGKKVI